MNKLILLITIFSIIIAMIAIVLFFIRKKINSWVYSYISASDRYELRIDRKKCTILLKELYRTQDSLHGGHIIFYYKNSILFYEKKHNKYFSIESYYIKEVFSFKKKKYEINEIYSEELSGETIFAWINRGDMNSEIYGTEKNPVRIFRLEYDSEEFLTDEYSSNVERYMIDFRSDRTLQNLFIVNSLLLVLSIVLFFNIINCLFF